MRPIDADALNQSIKESFELSNIAYEETTDAFEKEIYKMQLMVFAECGCRVKEAPTLTLDDLRAHGAWITQNSGYTKFQCSVCGSKNHDICWPFCCKCGAKMDLPLVKFGAKMDKEEDHA